MYKFKLIYIKIYDTIYFMIEKSYFQKYFINEEYKILLKKIENYFEHYILIYFEFSN